MSASASFSIRAKIREVGLHSAVYGLGSIAQSAVQFLLIPVLTARLATAEFGAYALIQLASVVSGAVFFLGMTSALPRSYFDFEDERDRRSVFTTAFLLLLAGAFAQVALGHFVGGWISNLLLETDRYRGAIFWAFAGGALSFVNQFFFTYLRFQRRSVASIALSILALVGSMWLSVYLLSIDKGDITAPFRAIAFAQAAVALTFLIVYGRYALTLAINRAEAVVLMKFGIPTIIGSLGALTIDWVDRIFIERMLTLKDVAVYSVGYKLGSIVNVLVITPFVQIWNPMMFEYRSHENIGEFFSRIVSYYFLVSCTVLIGACFFMTDALPVVARSADYAAAAPVILLIMAGYVLNGATNIVSAGLFYSRQIFRFVVVYYAIAAGNIGLNFIFIPTFGIVGAAVTSLMTYAAIPVCIYWQASRYFPIQFEWWRLVRVAVVTSACLTFALFINVAYVLSLPVRAVLFLGVIAAYALFCTDDSEKQQIRRVLRLLSHTETAPTTLKRN